GRPITSPFRESPVGQDVLAFNKPVLAQAIEERVAGRLRRDSRVVREKADAIDFPRLLRPCRKRPCRRATEPSDEFAPSKANPHLPPPSRMGALSRQHSTAESCGPRSPEPAPPPARRAWAGLSRVLAGRLRLPVRLPSPGIPESAKLCPFHAGF